ncbi:hypothetical protein D3C81_1310620 [compost metagenome]
MALGRVVADQAGQLLAHAARAGFLLLPLRVGAAQAEQLVIKRLLVAGLTGLAQRSRDDYQGPLLAAAARVQAQFPVRRLDVRLLDHTADTEADHLVAGEVGEAVFCRLLKVHPEHRHRIALGEQLALEAAGHFQAISGHRPFHVAAGWRNKGAVGVVH